MINSGSPCCRAIAALFLLPLSSSSPLPCLKLHRYYSIVLNFLLFVPLLVSLPLGLCSSIPASYLWWHCSSIVPVPLRTLPPSCSIKERIHPRMIAYTISLCPDQLCSVGATSDSQGWRHDKVQSAGSLTLGLEVTIART